ncbi:MAG TPA: hypothetical protein VEY09_12855 [Pyrinomonadaceae bacterium]|nr:hypothetical protein [Pyrinomonadaceae bacterium]
MRKTLFSILPLLVFLGPTYNRLPLFFGANLGGAAPATVEAADALRPVNAIAGEVRGRLEEARRALEELPSDTTEFVTLAVAAPDGAGLHLLRLAKQEFLKKNGEIAATAVDGARLTLKIVRPNYVNTAVEVLDEAGRALQPLVVRYPIEKEGRLKEVAYYTSAHPAVGSDEEVMRAGREYVRERLNEAAARLAAKGKRVSPDLIDVAERLCFVEHTDHQRFLTEDRGALFREIQALYALNDRDTYRYSVSSAGAGGMVQMIPPTYKAIREQHASVGLKEDFVEGMRDHANALEAMLLYMQDTWDHLLRQEEVRAALSTGQATQAELLAAGYNSNPFKLPKYLRQGGSGWRALIPEETKMYLRIYASLEEHVRFNNRA